MKKRIIAVCAISFLAGIAVDRVFVHSEVNELKSEVTTAFGQMFGYENEQAMRLMQTVTAEYSAEEFVQILEEVAAMGRKTENLFHDERLYSTLRNLSYLEILRESGAGALDREMREDVLRFYEDYEHILLGDPSNQFEESSLAALKRIQDDLNLVEQTKEVDRDGGINSESLRSSP